MYSSNNYPVTGIHIQTKPLRGCRLQVKAWPWNKCIEAGLNPRPALKMRGFACPASGASVKNRRSTSQGIPHAFAATISYEVV